MTQAISPLWGPSSACVNAGAGPHFDVLEVGHKDYVALINADTAFWVLSPRAKALDYLLGAELPKSYLEKEAKLAGDLETVRFKLLVSAVYFNPTERCNLDCGYCYLPREARRTGQDMDPARLLEALDRLQDFFVSTLPEGARPQLVFHGSEPLLAKDAVFQGIEQYGDYFRFGVQTNTVLLDRAALDFLKAQGAGIGISLDGPTPEVADRTRRTWGGSGVFAQTVKVLEELVGYPGLNVITTVTKENVRSLPELVEFYHARGVTNALLNPVRGTQAGGRALMPDQTELAHFFFKALDRAFELYEKTGRKLVIGNFANLLLGLVAPGARRLMCDISPCGGGRCFFAVGAGGEVAPCSEFLGLPEFHGGNLFKDPVKDLLATPAFKQVTTRMVENLDPCKRCAVRHVCGAPCPAEVYAFNGHLNAPAPLCDFYAAQARYAFKVIADGRLDALLWDNWQEGLEEIVVM
ncbi:MAG: peptide-modifying radical SAM enzyme CbpB [Deltaproteobacteria bacterium]|nr:peptide-modifying radical SAM enzyme CbpB [Deltaproteobacteria bacterium]MBI4796365.1 peptide-modifying radical SAM enzyme CbpB [Deltaproteobacteria bacterium]